MNGIVDSFRRVKRLPLETHLTISDPDRFLEEFAAAGSDSFLVHVSTRSRRQWSCGLARRC